MERGEYISVDKFHFIYFIFTRRYTNLRRPKQEININNRLCKLKNKSKKLGLRI